MKSKVVELGCYKSGTLLHFRHLSTKLQQNMAEAPQQIDPDQTPPENYWQQRLRRMWSFIPGINPSPEELSALAQTFEAMVNNQGIIDWPVSTDETGS